MGDAGVHGPGVIAGEQHLLQGSIQHLGQPLPAEFRGTGQRRPTTLDIGSIGRRKTLRRAYITVVQAAALAIARCIQRGQHLFTEAGGLFQHLSGQVEIDICIGRHCLPGLLGPQPVLQHELHVRQWRLPGHGLPRVQAVNWGFSISSAMPWPPPMQAAAIP